MIRKQQRNGRYAWQLLLLIAGVVAEIAKEALSELKIKLAFRVSGLLSALGELVKGCYEYYSLSQTTANKPLDIAEVG